MNRLIPIVLLVFSSLAFGQAPFALMPVPRQCFSDSNGAPLAGGKLHFYDAGTTNPAPTYTDYLGLAQNQNPVILDAAGCALIWLGPQSYKVTVSDANDVQLYSTDQLSNTGQLLWNASVLLLPTSHGLQTVVGPLGVDYIVGNVPQTSPGLQVGILDPVTKLNTPVNPPNFETTQPALPGQHYHTPDPGTPHASYVLSPGGDGSSNILDCSQPGIHCKRTAHVYFEGGGCNNLTPAMGWDTFGTNSPTPICLVGTNIQKGLLAFPAAATYVQENSVSCAAAVTCAITYPITTVAGNLLEVEVVVDGTHTVTGCTDGTNAYTLAIAKAQGALNVSIWYFNGNSTSKTAGTTLTCTFNAGTPNSAMDFKEYSGTLTAGLLDQTASNGNAGSTTVSTGTTAGTAQAVELVLAAVGTVGNAAITGQNGWTKHATASQSTNVSVASQGQIQQNTQTQTAAFTLASSELWAAVIATFKVSVASDISAQRTWFTPTFFSTTGAPVATSWVWQGPLAPTGTVTVSLGAQIGCAVPGSTDDASFNTALTAIGQVSATGPNIITTTNLTPLVSTGCAASNLLHLRLFRQRYNVNDTYEGYVLLDGAPLFFGINQ